MAVVTRVIAEFSDGSVRWSYDYNDASFKLLSFDCVNDSSFPTKGTITAQSDGTTVTAIVQPGVPLHQSISTAVANKFNLGIASNGKLSGISHSFQWPWLEG